MSPWLIQTFLRSLPRMCARRREPSKQSASRRPFPSIFTTCAYSGGLVGLAGFKKREDKNMMREGMCHRTYLGLLP